MHVYVDMMLHVPPHAYTAILAPLVSICSSMATSRGRRWLHVALLLNNASLSLYFVGLKTTRYRLVDGGDLICGELGWLTR